MDHGGFGLFKVTEKMDVQNNTPPDYMFNIVDMPLCGWKPTTTFIRYYTDYIVTIFGCVSNALVLAVLAKSRKILRSVTGVFLLSLTISDTLVLLTNIVDSINRSPVESHIVMMSTSACVVVSWLKLASRFAASNLVLLISVNRFAVIISPFSSHKYRRIKCAIVQVSVVAALSFVVNFYAISIDTTSCGCKPAMIEVYTYGVTVVDVIYCDVLVGLAVTVLSSWTIYAFRKSGSFMSGERDLSASQRRRGERHMTVLLLTVAVTFVLLRLPYTVTWAGAWFIHFGENFNEPDKTGNKLTLINISNILHIPYMLNHAINLYLYCLCSNDFRGEFIRMVTCGRTYGRRQQSSTGTGMRVNTATSTSAGSMSRKNSAFNSTQI